MQAKIQFKKQLENPHVWKFYKILKITHKSIKKSILAIFLSDDKNTIIKLGGIVKSVFNLSHENACPEATGQEKLHVFAGVTLGEKVCSQPRANTSL